MIWHLHLQHGISSTRQFYQFVLVHIYRSCDRHTRIEETNLSFPKAEIPDVLVCRITTGEVEMELDSVMERSVILEIEGFKGQ